MLAPCVSLIRLDILPVDPLADRGAVLERGSVVAESRPAWIEPSVYSIRSDVPPLSFVQATVCLVKYHG
ncbi:hypothetical protein GCM10020218_074570 [Dactylosporangium vinaceum]